ncbi:MAG TPA: GNAT family N-acetyltransferase [Ktedonobacterales bacterium]|nr:GNAT family N-acetyltransferase [Ktedonobacterales bacterium]
MSSPSAFIYRPFQPEADLPRLVALLAAAEAADQEDDDVSPEAVAAQMAAPGHDPARDRWVAVAHDQPEVLLGSGALWKAPTAERADLTITVLPGHRRRGIGSALLRRVIAHARTLGAASLGAYADARTLAGDAFLRAHGFAPVAAYTQLRVGGEVVPPPAVWPTDYTISRYDSERGFDTLLEAFNRCFEGLWGHNPVTADDLTAWLPQLPLDGIFIARGPDGRVAGVVRAEPAPRRSVRNGAPTANVDAPGVAPQHRDKPLYVPLLLTAWHWARALSPAPALIELESWGDEPTTLALYQNLGFALVRRAISYRLDLP